MPFASSTASGDLAERIQLLPEGPAGAPADAALERLRHATIQRVTRDYERFRFNTIVAALMELVNAMTKAMEEKTASRGVCEAAFDSLLQLLHPVAPHLTEELWQARGHDDASLLDTTWPAFDAAKAQAPRVTLVIQIDGKVRDRVEVDSDVDEGTIRQLALASEKSREWIRDREIVKVVVVPGRLVNIVTAGGRGEAAG